MDYRAAFAPAPVDIQLGEWEYTIPALPASEWIEAIASRDLTRIVPGLLAPADRDDVEMEYMQTHLDPEDIARVAREAIQEAGGRHWWEVQRLIDSSTHRDLWTLAFGRLILAGFDFEHRSLGAFIAALYTVTHDLFGNDDTRRTQFETELAMPPEGVDLDDLIDDAEEAADFEADLAEFDPASG